MVSWLKPTFKLKSTLTCLNLKPRKCKHKTYKLLSWLNLEKRMRNLTKVAFFILKKDKNYKNN